MKSLETFLESTQKQTFKLNELYDLSEIDWEISVTTEAITDAFRQFMDDLNAFVDDWTRRNAIKQEEFITDA